MFSNVGLHNNLEFFAMRSPQRSVGRKAFPVGCINITRFEIGFQCVFKAQFLTTCCSTTFLQLTIKHCSWDSIILYSNKIATPSSTSIVHFFFSFDRKIECPLAAVSHQGLYGVSFLQESFSRCLSYWREQSYIALNRAALTLRKNTNCAVTPIYQQNGHHT